MQLKFKANKYLKKWQLWRPYKIVLNPKNCIYISCPCLGCLVPLILRHLFGLPLCILVQQFSNIVIRISSACVTAYVIITYIFYAFRYKLNLLI